MITGEAQMTWPMRDFDLAQQLAMYGATAGCLLLVFGVVAGAIFLVKAWLRSGRYHRSIKP
jgi:hypothetical protein